MGQPSSSPSPPCLREPWRNLPEKNQEILHFITSYQPRKRNGHLRILLHGPVGAGKSSFINSVESVVLGRTAGRAQTDAASGVSFTTKYKTYKIPKDETRRTHCNFVFNDVMGLETEDRGVHVEDLELAQRGRVAEGYEFSPDRPLTKGDPSYKKSPSLADKVHVLVCVVPAASLPLISDEVVKKMRDVRLEASRLEIPQLAIITKVDEACPEVKKDIKNMYKSKFLKEQVEKLHQLLGLPINCIFLVKNYSSEVEMSPEMNVQILQPLKQIIVFGNDFLNNHKKKFCWGSTCMTKA